MTDFTDFLNANAPPSVKTLGGKIASFDPETGEIEFHFVSDESHTHSGNIVQGGFVAGMLDAAMAHVAFCVLNRVVVLATLEIKVSYLAVTNPGELIATGRVLRMGKSVAFMEAELKNAAGKLLAKGSSTAQIIDRPPADNART